MVSKSKIFIDRDTLQHMYINEGMTTREIGAKTKISHRTVARRLSEYGIPPRPQGPKRHEKLRDIEWLKYQYETLGKSSIAISTMIGASAGVVIHWLHANGITVRPQNQHKGRKWDESVKSRMSMGKQGKYTGEDNPNWKGGQISDYRRERTSYNAKVWSKKVRTRDERCVECGDDKNLHAHHVKSWKTHPSLKYDLSNGITLCVSCHQKVHKHTFPTWVFNHHDEISTSAKHPMG